MVIDLDDNLWALPFGLCNWSFFFFFKGYNAIHVTFGPLFSLSMRRRSIHFNSRIGFIYYCFIHAFIYFKFFEFVIPNNLIEIYFLCFVDQVIFYETMFGYTCFMCDILIADMISFLNYFYRLHHYQGAWNCHAVSWTEPNWGRASGYDQWGWCWWEWYHWFPGVP